ncbi:MAG: dTDP-4-dehydrorhamnose reductase [Flavisolibacter sp.]
MSNQKIIVTGSKGQLGNELKDISTLFPQYDFIFFSREEFPINDEELIQKILSEHSPQYLVNCAAYTAVDKAENEQASSTEINATAVGLLAKYSLANKTKFIHISTDYVFNAFENIPLKEADSVDPVNFYGRTKLLGEQLAFEHNPGSIVIRTSWVYSSYGNNFVKTMIRLMNERESINVVNDQYGSPTYAFDLASLIMQIIEKGIWIPGVYHFSNRGVVTWFDFANEIRALIKSGCKINPISTDQFPTAAKRPSWSVLDSSKIQEVFGVHLKDWKESLRNCLVKLKDPSSS